MSPGLRRVTAGALATVSALAGCAGSSPAAPPGGAASSSPAALSPTGTARQTPSQYAASQVPAMIRAFTPPPGARPVSTSPSAALDFVEASTTDVDKNLVDQFAEWVVPGKPADVLARAASGVPAGYHLIGAGNSGAGVLDNVLQLPPVPGLLNLREMDVSVVLLAARGAAGQPLTGMRVDALAGWVAAAPAQEWIPAAARVMTITETQPLRTNPAGGSGPPPPPVTITDAAQVRDIVTDINSMQPVPAGDVYSCPADYGGEVTVTFRASVGGPLLGAVSLGLSGCGFVAVLANGEPHADLRPADGSTDVLARVGRITGLDWAATLKG